MAAAYTSAAQLSSEAQELAQLRREAVERKVEDLIQSGRVLPVFRDEVLSFAAHLGSSDNDVNNDRWLGHNRVLHVLRANQHWQV